MDLPLPKTIRGRPGLVLGFALSILVIVAVGVAIRSQQSDGSAVSPTSTSTTPITPSPVVAEKVRAVLSALRMAGSRPLQPADPQEQDPLRELLETQQEDPSADPRANVIEQFDVVIDEKLGRDFPMERRVRLGSIQWGMLTDAMEIDALLAQHEISQDEYDRRHGELIDRSGREAAAVLTDAEYQKLFDIGKDEPLSSILEHGNENGP